MPIPPTHFALALHLRRVVASPSRRAAARGFNDLDVALFVAVQYRFDRVVKAVAIACLGQRELGLHRI